MQKAGSLALACLRGGKKNTRSPVVCRIPCVCLPSVTEVSDNDSPVAGKGPLSGTFNSVLQMHKMDFHICYKVLEIRESENYPSNERLGHRVMRSSR